MRNAVLDAPMDNGVAGSYQKREECVGADTRSVGLVVSIAGAVVTWNVQPPVGPHWYALTIAAISIPCAWLGGKIYERQNRFR